MLTTVKDYLIRTCTCLRHYPYISKFDALVKNINSTADIVFNSRSMAIKNTENFKNLDEVNEIIEWVANLPDKNTYYSSLKTVFNRTIVSRDDIAMICSSVIAYRQYINKNRADYLIQSLVTVNSFVGSVGDVLNGTGQYISSQSYTQFKKKSWLTSFVDGGNLFSYYSKTKPAYIQNELFDYTGKIKAHGKLESGVKYTQLEML